MSLDFPSSPSNGQVFDKFYWDASIGAWRLLASSNSLDALSDVDVSSATNGQSIAYDSSVAKWVPFDALGKVNASVTTASTSESVVRNVKLSTSDPSGGNDGDIWMVYS